MECDSKSEEALSDKANRADGTVGQSATRLVDVGVGKKKVEDSNLDHGSADANVIACSIRGEKVGQKLAYGMPKFCGNTMQQVLMFFFLMLTLLCLLGSSHLDIKTSPNFFILCDKC